MSRRAASRPSPDPRHAELGAILSASRSICRAASSFAPSLRYGIDLYLDNLVRILEQDVSVRSGAGRLVSRILSSPGEARSRAALEANRPEGPTARETRLAAATVIMRDPVATKRWQYYNTVKRIIITIIG